MLNIRNTVHETEKSIKRLGERSHEISAIVEIIKDIAERTHTLALNAGMQAVAAGEAGRGFSIVADEVQRLAEMARESTGRITLLVKSIQAESSESMRIMNKAIDQVVVGSDKADIASEAMRSTGEAAGTLLEAINRLTEQSKEQAAYNEGLNNMAGQLRITSEATGAELVAQAEQTEAMLANMQQLVQSVEVFTLPGERKPA
jgi:methyl-accepting chemotaxis protein